MSIPTIIDTLCEISGQLHGIHASIKRQTEILVRMTEKPKEAAPAPNGITWQASVRYLHDYCGSITEVECNKGVCPMADFCGRHLKGRFSSMPCNWEVPGDE